MDDSLSLMVEAVDLTISIAFPALFAVSALSLLLSIIQTVTSVQEQTMQFILKVSVFFWVFNTNGQDSWFRLEVFTNRILSIIRNV